jgi:hypothetical protein
VDFLKVFSWDFFNQRVISKQNLAGLILIEHLIRTFIEVWSFIVSKYIDQVFILQILTWTRYLRMHGICFSWLSYLLSRRPGHLGIFGGESGNLGIFMVLLGIFTQIRQIHVVRSQMWSGHWSGDSGLSLRRFRFQEYYISPWPHLFLCTKVRLHTLVMLRYFVFVNDIFYFLYMLKGASGDYTTSV